MQYDEAAALNNRCKAIGKHKASNDVGLTHYTFWQIIYSYSVTEVHNNEKELFKFCSYRVPVISIICHFCIDSFDHRITFTPNTSGNKLHPTGSASAKSRKSNSQAQLDIIDRHLCSIIFTGGAIFDSQKLQ
jgi:hypothetical protein